MGERKSFPLLPNTSPLRILNPSISSQQLTFPLTGIQHGMFVTGDVDDGGGIYLVQCVGDLREPLDVERFHAAWVFLVDRHEILRTTFSLDRNGNPEQSVHSKFDLPWRLIDLSEKSPVEQELELEALEERDLRTRFEDSGSLFRIVLVRLKDDRFKLLWTSHHAIIDGRSCVILLKELFSAYESLRCGEEYDFPPAVPFRQFAEWLQSRDNEASLKFWSEAMLGVSEASKLNISGEPKGKRPLVKGSRSSLRTSHRIELPGPLTLLLRKLCDELDITPNTVMQGAWAVLLSRYSGQETIAFGSIRSGRGSVPERISGATGPLISTIPVPVSVEPSQRVTSFLQAIHRFWVAMRPHEHTPLHLIRQGSQFPAGPPLFESLVIFEDYHLNDHLHDLGGDWGNRSFRVESPLEFPLEVSATGGAMIEVSFDYDSERYSEGSIARMTGHFLTLLEGIVAAPGDPVGELPMLTEGELHQLCMEWNDTAVEYSDKCVHQLFEEQAEHAPEAVALVLEGKRLTYGELNERANQLAHHLISLGVGPDALVGICVEPSFEMIVGLLGILKAGGAYVPLDPDYPEARLAFMLEDCGDPLLLTTEGLSRRFVGLTGNLLFMDDDSALTGQSVENPGILIDSEHLAYVIYTSGLKGRSKGVEIPHRGVVRLVCDNGYCCFDRDRVFLQFAPLFSDAATFEIWGSLLNGARLVVAQFGSEAVQKIPELVVQHGITTVWLTAGLFNRCVNKDPELLSGIEELLIGGEALSPRHVSKALAGLPGTRIINGYGPTENTTFTCTFLIEQCEDHSPISIGRPIANTRVYILDDALNLLPIGVAGELCIGGDGLARSFLNRPGLTAERFVEIEILGRTERVYRSGDRCRWQSDGNLEFLGRIDHQVKIRGFRIETGEIEAVLGDCSGIKESVVMAREDTPGDKRFVVYFVLDEKDPVMMSTLRRALAAKLPEYMIPTAFVSLDALPLGPYGKVDCGALPVPEMVRSAAGVEYTAPRTPQEKELAHIWAEVLGVDRVGIHDSFFELGGQAQLIERLVGLVNERLDSNLTIGDVYRSPKIVEMACLLKRSARRDVSEAVAIVGRHLTVLQQGSGGGCVILVGQHMAGNLKDLPKSLMVLHLAIDGFGRSSFLGLSVRDAAKAYAEELEILTMGEPIVIVGYSYGGLLAYALAHTLRECSVKNFELILLEPEMRGSEAAKRRKFWKKVRLTIGKGPGVLVSSLVKSVVFRVRRRLPGTIDKIEDEGANSNIGQMLETGEPLTGYQLFIYYRKDIGHHIRTYRPSRRLEGRVHLVFGKKWGELNLSLLTREYLESSPVLFDLGEVAHLELISKASAKKRWQGLVCDLVSPNHGAGDKDST